MLAWTTLIVKFTVELTITGLHLKSLVANVTQSYRAQHSLTMTKLTDTPHTFMTLYRNYTVTITELRQSIHCVGHIRSKLHPLHPNNLTLNCTLQIYKVSLEELLPYESIWSEVTHSISI